MADNLFYDTAYRVCLFDDSRWDVFAFKNACERRSLNIDIDIYQYINPSKHILNGNHRYDAIIIDLYQYGSLSGLDFIKYCRNYVNTKNTLLIGISGSDVEKDKQLALTFGADIFLLKNDIFALTHAIMKALDLRYQILEKSRLSERPVNYEAF